MANLWHDLKQSLRSLFKNPGFTLAAVAALALGIGTNTAIFTVVNTVLLKPLTYPDADRIVQFLLTSPDGKGPGASPTKFNNWRQQTSVFQDVTAYDFGGPGFNLTGDHPEQVHGIHVSEGYFRLFGAPVILGRTFTQQEDSPNGGKVVVISYGLWQRKFGGNPNIVGSALSLGNEPYTIVGVLGQSFVFDPEADIWLPFQIDPNSTNQGHFFLGAARLKPGVTLAQANAQLGVAADQFRRKYPEGALGPKDGFAVEPLRDSIVSDVRSSLFILLGAVSLVLLIACANVASLLLVRASGRKREFAIRVSMGATRGRIIRQLLTESVLLAFTGGALGLILGYLGVRGLLALSPGDIPRIGENGASVGIDWRVLAFTIGVSLITGVLFGLFPAIGASRPDLNTTLKESSNRSGTGFRQSKVRSLLVVTEVSLSIVLLIGAALLIRTFVALRNVDPGFNAHNVLTMEMSLTGDRFQKTIGVAQLVQIGRERINAIPGVEASASTCCLPLEGGFGLPFDVVGRPHGKDPNTGGAGWMNTSPGYFDVFKIPILRGRDFKDSDNAGAPGVVLINDAMAKKFWPKENPVGQQIVIGKGVGPQFDEPARQIIGVVGDIHDGGLNRDPRPLMIVPQAQVHRRHDRAQRQHRSGGLARPHPHRPAPVLHQRAPSSSVRPAADFPSPASVPWTKSSSTPPRARTSTCCCSPSSERPRSSSPPSASTASWPTPCSSAPRRWASAWRSAPTGRRIRNLVVWQGMRLAIAGTIIGIGAALAVTRFIASFLFGVKPYDPIVFVAVPVILSVVALFAVWLPATRASKLDPMESLRVE